MTYLNSVPVAVLLNCTNDYPNSRMPTYHLK
jgi:hypothetical protein